MKPNNNPWLWVPTLYFAEGIPYFIVNDISKAMFTQMGMPESQMSLITSILYFPWVLKPLWSPFVDVLKNKHWWIMTMQVIMSCLLLVLPFVIPNGNGLSLVSSPLFYITFFLFILTAFASATHDIAADGFYMIGLETNEQAVFVGVRSMFYRLSSIFGQGVLVSLAGILDRSTNVHVAWQLTLIVAALIFAGVTLYHTWHLPRPSNDIIRENKPVKEVFKEFGRTMVTFFKKKYIWFAIIFMLLYRLPEAFLLNMLYPFMQNPIDKGGLGVSLAELGFLKGTIGAVAMIAGGILGGMMAHKWGLRKSLWPMALSLTLPCLSFVFLAMFQPESRIVIGSCFALDQFGYGFGFTAYMLYMIYFSEGEYKTAHYSICTAFMALSIMLPGLVAGYVLEWLGYTNFFIFVMLCCLATFAVTLKLRTIVDPEFGKKQNQ